jgi:hypothetical protein
MFRVTTAMTKIMTAVRSNFGFRFLSHSAALTAAYGLLEKTDIKLIVLEMTTDIGGISKTVSYKCNKTCYNEEVFRNPRGF